MRGEIFICHHAPVERPLRAGPFRTLISGAHSDEAAGFLGDLDGDNIAFPDTHGEMRHQYHVARARLGGLDFVGFEHYRRSFLVSPVPLDRVAAFSPRLAEVFALAARDLLRGEFHADPELFETHVEFRRMFRDEYAALFAGMMAGLDVVTRRPTEGEMGAQLDRHHPADWRVSLEDAVRETRLYREVGHRYGLEIATPFYTNMYVMRAPLFGDYIGFWEDFSAHLGRMIGPAPRIYGYFAERLVNFFLYWTRCATPGLRTASLPILVGGKRE